MPEHQTPRQRGPSVEELFYGAVTVGDRGQIVIPAALRRDEGINPGDRLLVFRHGLGGALLLAKVDAFHQFLEQQLELLRGELGRSEEGPSGPAPDEGDDGPDRDGGDEA